VLFDERFYVEINQARWSTAARILDRLPGIRTCLDVGCGPGWFADKLCHRGLAVVGVDGRAELVEEARRRVPNGEFCTADITDREAMKSVPRADLVFCFGLLYHLENPFAAVRNLYACASRHLLVETQLAPDAGPVFRLVSEGENETQGLNFLAVIPTRDALVKMLYSAGFGCVERYTGRTEHPDFNDLPDRVHRREIFLASANATGLPDFIIEPEPVTPKIDYKRPAGKATS
jgi:SAM-dependent methyltransferase